MTASKDQLAMAAIFRKAANLHLCVRGIDTLTKFEFSCHALSFAENGNRKDNGHAVELCEELGANSMSNGFLNEIWDHWGRSNIQGARFLWLHFVAEGLERGEIEL